MPLVDPNGSNNNSNPQPVAQPVTDYGVPPTVASPLLDDAAQAMPVAPTAPVAPAPAPAKPGKYSEDLLEEHPLISSVPENLDTGKSETTSNGVKEFAGPPLAPVVSPNAVEPTPITPAIPEPVLQTPVVAEPIMAAPPINAMPEPIASALPPLPNTPMDTSASGLKDETKVSLNDLTPSENIAPAIEEPKSNKDNLGLQGSAQGKEKVVEQILNNADLLVGQQSNETMASPLAGGDVLITAGEKFISEKSTLDDLFKIAIEKDASDLHVSVGYPPTFRVDGALISLGGEDMTQERVEKLFLPMLNPLQAKELKEKLDVDFSYTHSSGNRFRINFFHKKGTLAGAFRLIPQRIRSVAELNLPQVLYDFINIPYGLVLVTGPTGNGKSTTLAALIEEINMNQARHIITIEDPVEYIFPKGKSIIEQREINTDTISWTRALREVLRQDPNVVLIGEMRDFETIAAAITVAETGHLVFATLHTNSASQTLDRLVDVFPENQQQQVRAQLANVIAAVVSQRLVPVNKGGRKAVVEVMIASPAVRNAIREAKTYQIDNIIQTSTDLGMITLEKSLINFIRSGDLTLEQAQMYTVHPDELSRLLRNN